MSSGFDKLYSKRVMQHFQHPKNIGEIKNAGGIGRVGNAICGDVMWCYIKVKDGIIKGIKMKTYGCVAAIATSSMITTLVKGKTLEYAKKITRDEVKDALGGLPPIKLHCSNLAADALQAAIKDYESKKKAKSKKQN